MIHCVQSKLSSFRRERDEDSGRCVDSVSLGVYCHQFRDFNTYDEIPERDREGALEVFRSAVEHISTTFRPRATGTSRSRCRTHKIGPSMGYLHSAHRRRFNHNHNLVFCRLPMTNEQQERPRAKHEVF